MSDSTAMMGDVPRKRLRKRWIILGIVALLLGLLYVVGPMVAEPILRQRLQAMVSKHLNAELTMDRLSYHFPYGVNLHNAALMAWDEKGEKIDLLRVKELDLHLAKLPLGDGPLVIKRIIIKQPSAHLILKETGLLGARGLVKKEDQTTPNEIASSTGGKPKKEKPSDYFRLRRFEIHDGQIVFEDRRQRSNRPPLTWKNLTVALDTEPASGSLYSYELSANNAGMATANARGKVDVDTAILNIERFVLGVKVERGKRQEQLPPSWQEILQRYDVAGSIAYSGSATVPLKDPASSTYQALLELTSGSAKISQGPGRVDRLALKARMTSQERVAATQELSRPIVASQTAVAATQRVVPNVDPSTVRAKQPPMTVNLDLLEIGTGDTLLHVEKGVATIDAASDQWRVKDLLCQLELGKDRSGLPSKIEKALSKLDLSGKLKMTATAAGPLRPAPGSRLMDQVDFQVVAYPRDWVVKPLRWATPFTGVSGTIHADRDTLSMENVEAQFQGDRFFVTAARIPLAHIEDELRIDEISGSMNLTGKVEAYGRPFGFIAHRIRPSGTWYAIGYLHRKNHQPPGTKPDFRFDIRSDDAAGLLGKKEIPITQVKTEIVSTTALTDIKRLEGICFGGAVTGEGQVAPGKGKDLAYQGKIWIRDLDLKGLADLVAVKGRKPSRLSGKGNVNAQIEGIGPDGEHTGVDNFRANGRFEVLEGDFWSLPAIDEVTRSAKVKGGALTVGQAAGVFKIHDRVVELTNAALSAPMLGVQGAGKVTFDGNLDLHVVAAPLADWKDQLKRTRIPVVSDVAGEVLGGLQKMINTATTTLLYEFHVTGTTREPKIETIPTPVLTEGVAKIFGSMLKGEKLGDVVDGREMNDAQK
jgi:hypothetical protein